MYVTAHRIGIVLFSSYCLKQSYIWPFYSIYKAIYCCMISPLKSFSKRNNGLVVLEMLAVSQILCRYPCIYTQKLPCYLKYSLINNDCGKYDSSDCIKCRHCVHVLEKFHNVACQFSEQFDLLCE